MSQSKVRPIPEGFHSITPHLIIKGAAQALEFYKKAFGAKEISRMPMGDKIGHAEMRIGSSVFFLADEVPDWGIRGPVPGAGSPVTIHLYVEDCDKFFIQAVAAGATSKQPPTTMFWGDRYGKLQDPFGHDWSVATHVEDVDPAEMPKRMEAAMAGKPC